MARFRPFLWIGVLFLAALGWNAAGEVHSSQRFQSYYQGEEVEHFLRTGKVIALRGGLDGVTRPRKATLEREGVTRFAVFKNIDVKRHGMTTLESGAVDVHFQDSWRTEVAAYEIDRMIGLGMVPATVERRVLRDRGSIQIWVDNEMSEADRVERGLQPPDVQSWNEGMSKVRMFDELICNVDRHLNNLLITEDWQIVAIDHSRAFRPIRDLRESQSLTRFSRSLLEGMARLDERTVRNRVGRHLTSFQVRALIARRDLILKLAGELVAEKGEAAVLFP